MLFDYFMFLELVNIRQEDEYDNGFCWIEGEIRKIC